MPGYTWRDPQRWRGCTHDDFYWRPPAAVVILAGCPECDAQPGRPCTRRRRPTEPHPARYAWHHRQFCQNGMDWSTESTEFAD